MVSWDSVAKRVWKLCFRIIMLNHFHFPCHPARLPTARHRYVPEVRMPLELPPCEVREG